MEKEKGTVRAEMRGTIWANDFLRINQRFLQVTREPLREGIHILFRALVKFHPVYGLSLQIIDIDPTYTLGEMAREKMETINKLKKEGIFDRNKKLPVPVLPQRIAIISVKTSKGFSDFMSILKGNQWGYAFSCYLFPALLQGDKAVDSILGQLRAIRELADHFDVVAIIRGGGGDVGLNCYDHHSLAREVAVFPLPVLTGIGHSTNETVVEMVSGQNLITPTDVAYFIIQKFHNFSVHLKELTEERCGFRNRDDRRGEAGEQRKRGGDWCREQGSGWKRRSGEAGRREGGWCKGPGNTWPMERHKGKGMGSSLRWQSERLFQQETMSLKQLEEQIRILDPVNILKRGYSITYADGRVLRDVSEVQPGKIITTKLYHGNINSEVKSKSE